MNIIYGLIDPRNGQLRYIGKSETGKSRLTEHLKPSSLANDTHKDRWLKQLVALNLKPAFIVLEEFSIPDELFAAEEFWYEYFVGLGCNLTNSTKCGRGTRGYKHTGKTKLLIGTKASIRSKGKPLPAGMCVAKEIVVVDGKDCRHCPKCDQLKEVENYRWNASRRRFYSYCKPCRALNQASRRKANPPPRVSEEQYRASRLHGARAGGEASKTPERRAQTSKMNSKAVQGVHQLTKEIVTFSSALKAKEAGFQNSNLGQAIRSGKPYRGYIWTFT